MKLSREQQNTNVEYLMKLMLGMILVMNAIDAVLSIWFIQHTAILDELNPVAKYMMSIGDIPFVILKTFIVGIAVYMLWKYRHTAISKLGTCICFVSYSAIMWLFFLFILNVFC